MFDLLTSKKTSDAVRYSVIKDVLDRSGFKPVEEIKTTQVWNGDPSVLTDEQLDNLAETLTRMFRDPAKAEQYRKRALEIEGPVIDVEAIRVPEATVKESLTVGESPVDIDDEEGW